MDGVVRFDPQRRSQLYQVSRGDILVVARGQNHHACLITVDLSETLASNVFYIVRPREAFVLPGYLAWWLNQASTQAEISANARGTGIEYISRETIESLGIPIPALDTQRHIERIVKLWHKQQSIQTRLNNKREQLVHATCRYAMHTVKG